MKNVALLILALLPTLALAAKPDAEIARKANVIGNVAFGIQTHKVRGEDALDMVIALNMKQSGDTRADAAKNVKANAKDKDAGFSESVGWGVFANANEAAKYFANLQAAQDNKTGEEKDNSKQIALGQQIIKELGKMGAKLGFTDATSGYCGVSFGGLLVIDEEGDTVYEISMTDSGSC
ncbi:MAG: hypothetical protein ACXWQO_13570 [Bdellovibrionota bacterium]